MSVRTEAPPGQAAEQDQLRLERAGAWSGLVLLTVLFPVFIVLCGLWPPVDPSWSAEEMRDFWLQDTTMKRVGIAICLAVWTLMIPWTLALAAQTARAETRFRFLSLTQIICGASTAFAGAIMFLIWGVASFRPEDASPDTIRMLTDLGWFIFVMYWPAGTLWVWAVRLAVLMDRSERPLVPRWVAYLNFWAGLCFFPACLGLFFKIGPFAYNGAFTVWVPAGVFFVWYAVMSILMLGVNKRQSMECRSSA